MATWPESTRLIGSSIHRIDGMAKASGRAKYPSDIRPEGILFGVMLTRPLLVCTDSAIADWMAARPAVRFKNVVIGIRSCSWRPTATTAGSRPSVSTSSQSSVIGQQLTGDVVDNPLRHTRIRVRLPVINLWVY